MNTRSAGIINNLIYLFIGVGICLFIQLVTGLGQDVPGTGGLTRYQLAEMLYECDIGKYEGYCVADVNIRPRDEREERAQRD